MTLISSWSLLLLSFLSFSVSLPTICQVLPALPTQDLRIRNPLSGDGKISAADQLLKPSCVARPANVQKAGSRPNYIDLWQDKSCPLGSLSPTADWWGKQRNEERERLSLLSRKASSRQRAVWCTLWNFGSQQGRAEAPWHSFSFCSHW